MLDYAVLCICLLVAAILWSLARGVGWSKMRSLLTVFCALILPIIVSFVALIRPELALVQETVLSVMALLPFICILALANAKRARQQDASR